MRQEGDIAGKSVRLACALLATSGVAMGCSAPDEPARGSNAAAIERIAREQIAGGSPYWFTSGAAFNPKWGLEIRASNGVVVVSPSNRSEPWDARIELAENAATTPQFDGSRASFLTTDGTEVQWINGPLGLQVVARLEHDADVAKPAVLSFEIEGLVPIRRTLGHVLLADSAGVPRLTLSAPIAADASGSDVNVVWRASGPRLDLVVDDRDVEYPVVIDPFIRRIEAQLTQPFPEAEANFGASVALQGSYAMIGVPFDDTTYGGTDSGSVEVFVRGTSGASHLVTFAASNSGEELGTSISVGGNTMVAGAPFGLRTSPSYDRPGAAYVYRYYDRWVPEDRIQPAELTTYASFGVSVAAAGDTIAVGAPTDGVGAVYVFTRSASGTWSQQARLGALDDQFGETLALEGDTLVVGAPSTDLFAGAAHVFTRSGTTWTPVARLTPSAPMDFASFAASVALSGNLLAIGARSEDHSGVTNAGAVYIFERSGAAWVQRARLIAPAPDGGDEFGRGVAISNGRVIVGESGENVAGVYDVGVVHVYEGSGSTWSRVLQLSASDPRGFDSFGTAIDADGPHVIAGLPSRDGAAQNEGAAEVFRIGLVPGDACATGDDCISGFCVDGVCCDTACGGDSRDDCLVCAASAGAPADGTCSTLDAARAATTVCRAAISPCDVAETCVAGIAECPPDAIGPGGVECRPSAGTCDVAEHCDGMGAACPSDVVLSAGTECRSVAGVCDLAETCDGVSGACPADAFASATVECRASTATCDAAEHCTGSSPDCPDESMSPDGSGCSDGLACNGTETCVGAACTAGDPLTCDDGDPCTTDSCEEPMGCRYVAIAGCVVPDGGATADAGPSPPRRREERACGCHLVGTDPTDAPLAWLLLTALVFFGVRRTRRRAERTSRIGRAQSRGDSDCSGQLGSR